MSATALPGRPGIAATAAGELMAGDVLAHLDAQLASARRLREIVAAQGAAIRARDVDGVVRQVAAFHAELERRTRLEEERTRVLVRAGAALGVAPEAVTLTQLAAVLPELDAQAALERSAQLQALLARIEAEHAANQALMRQELAFLDHLLRLVDPAAAVPTYADPTRPARPAVPSSAAAPSRRSLDLHA